MKKLVLAGVASVFCVSSACAAESGVRAAYAKAPLTAPAPVYSWSGFYVGAHAGVAGGETCFSQVAPVTFAPNSPDTGCPKGNGLFGGGQIGANLQMSNLVAGVEFSGSFVDLGSRHTPPTNSVNSNLD